MVDSTRGRVSDDEMRERETARDIRIQLNLTCQSVRLPLSPAAR